MLIAINISEDTPLTIVFLSLDNTFTTATSSHNKTLMATMPLTNCSILKSSRVFMAKDNINTAPAISNNVTPIALLSFFCQIYIVDDNPLNVLEMEVNSHIKADIAPNAVTKRSGSILDNITIAIANSRIAVAKSCKIRT